MTDCTYCSSNNSSYVFWISIWILIIVFFVAAVACKSVLLILLMLVIAVAIGAGQCMYSNTSKCTCDGMDASKAEITFGDGHSDSDTEIIPNIGIKEAHVSEKARMEYEPELYYPRNTNLAAVKCATRNVDSGDQEDPKNCEKWITGYQGPEPWVDMEGALEKVAVDAMQEAESKTEPRILPEKCNPNPLPCDMRLAWQSSFIGCNSTFIEAPSCNIYERDDRLYNRRLDDIIQERAVQSGEKWDVYKHFHSRQNFTQFISEDLVNRKGFYERPIENLEESYCFGKKRPSEEVNSSSCSY